MSKAQSTPNSPEDRVCEVLLDQVHESQRDQRERLVKTDLVEELQTTYMKKFESPLKRPQEPKTRRRPTAFIKIEAKMKPVPNDCLPGKRGCAAAVTEVHGLETLPLCSEPFKLQC